MGEAHMENGCCCNAMDLTPLFCNVNYHTAYDGALVRFKQQQTSKLVDFSSCPDGRVAPSSKSAKGKGDPHMTNVKGQRFDILRAGSASLIQIPPESATHLHITGHIQQLDQRMCGHGLFFTQIDVNGDWLNKAITVKSGNESDKLSFFVMVDGQQVWSRRFKDDLGEQGHIVLNHTSNDSKLTITDITSKKQQGVEVEVSGVKIKVNHMYWPKKKISYLNIDLKGLKSIQGIGGILGTDDHSDWSAKPAECHSFARTQTSDDVFFASEASA